MQHKVSETIHNLKPFIKCFIFLLIGSLPGNAQPSFAGMEHLFTTPKSYIVPYSAQAPVIDGNLAEGTWQQSPWSEVFTDIEGDKKAKPAFQTKVKMLWTDSSLFIAAELQEPHVWGNLTQHDAIIYQDNDFEIFIDPANSTHQYFEIEVNALNTILDLLMPKPYRNGAGAMLSFDICQLQSAIKVHGTLNNAADQDVGWTVEMAIPFRALYTGNRWKAPEEGALWRINFSRVQWHTEIKDDRYVKSRDANGKVLPENNWVWSPQGVVNMHYPERWGYLQFTRKTLGANSTFQLPYNEKRKQYLWLLYYRQKEYQQKHRKYAASLKDLNITTNEVAVEKMVNKLKVEATSRQFTVSISDGNNTLLLNEEGFVQSINKVL